MKRSLVWLPLLVIPLWWMASSVADAQNWSNFSTPNESFSDEYYDSNIYDDARKQFGNTHYSGWAPRGNRLMSPWLRETWNREGGWRSGEYWNRRTLEVPAAVSTDIYYRAPDYRYPSVRYPNAGYIPYSHYPIPREPMVPIPIP